MRSQGSDASSAVLIDASSALMFELCIGSSVASPLMMIGSHGNQVYMYKSPEQTSSYVATKQCNNLKAHYPASVSKTYTGKG